jgi:hypothetical protein
MRLETFQDWGKPDGIAGSIPSTRINEARKQAERILFYKMAMAHHNGGSFELFKEHQHTKEDVDKAKQWLKTNHDVVSITVVQELV